jgi:AcrR family transcriptional regulator
MISQLAAPAATTDLPARERILWTAYGLFYRDGVRATGVDRVIAESGVTKVTFYRHFPSKNDLILAFLDARHGRWMAWFDAALQRHGNGAQALVPALAEWLEDADFRGCAFLNTTAELGASLAAVAEATRAHKRDMAERIAALLPASPRRQDHAHMLCVMADGAIVHAQFNGGGAEALQALEQAVALVLPAPA